MIERLDVNALADLIYAFGEERLSRRIARRIKADLEVEGAYSGTAALAYAVAGCYPPKARRGRIHPATRTFQALRIAVNDEYAELVDGLEAAERVLRPGGRLAVVTFHSIEDRIVKRFLQLKSDSGGGGSRHAPAEAEREPQFTQKHRKAIGPDKDELAVNPRSRSAKLRVAERTGAAPAPADRNSLGMPQLKRGF